MKLSGMTLTEIASNLNNRNVLPPKEYKYKSGDKRAINKNIRKTYWESGVVEAILKKIEANEMNQYNEISTPQYKSINVLLNANGIVEKNL